MSLTFLFVVFFIQLGYCDICKCVFKANVTMRAKQAALDYVCGVMSCAPISKGGSDYYPVTGSAHQDWAINAYFQEHRDDPDTACDFDGIAKVLCEDCTCVLKKNSSAYDMAALKKRLCNGDNNNDSIDCAPVDDPDGEHHIPNTLEDHTKWVVGEYYRKHDWTIEACKNKIVQLVPEACYPTSVRVQRRHITH